LRSGQICFSSKSYFSKYAIFNNNYLPNPVDIVYKFGFRARLWVRILCGASGGSFRMITTTLTFLAIAAGLDLGTNHPKLQPDYAHAMTRASEDHKPMAVFIGHGSDTFKHMLADGMISAESAKLLASSYVCVYLDTETASGKDWAGRFEMKEGLVISSPGGNVQAYRYSGTVPGTTLTKELTIYASAGQPATTVSAGAEAAKPYVIYSGCANGSCGTVTYPFGSSCPNGRCPNQR
jgi:hypothetical protein